MIVVIRIETWRVERPAAAFTSLSLHITSSAALQGLRASNTSKECAQVRVQPQSSISINCTHSFLSAQNSSCVFSFCCGSCWAYLHFFYETEKEKKDSRQLSFMLPAVKTKRFMHLPNVLKNYRVRTKTTFIFIAFQTPPALYTREISARAIFL